MLDSQQTVCIVLQLLASESSVIGLGSEFCGWWAQHLSAVLSAVAV